MGTMDRFRAMECFARIVENGSLSAAAKNLGISRSLISRHLQELESRLGSRLLIRTTRRMTLTESGASYFEFCRSIISQLQTEEHHVAGIQRQATGDLRVTAPKSFGSYCLSEAVAAFAANYPGLRISLMLGDYVFGTYDFVERGFDLALKLSPLTNSNLVARRVGTLRSVICASPEYLAQHRAPKLPNDLDEHRFLLHTDVNAGDQAWYLTGPKGRQSVNLRPSFISNSALVLRQAALAGVGVAIIPLYAVGGDIRNGALQCVLRNYEPQRRDLMAVYPHRGLVPRKIVVLVDYLIQWFARESKKRIW